MIIQGTIKNPFTGEVLPGATIAAINANGNPTGEGAAADDNGNFYLNTSAPQVRFSYVGYQTNILPTANAQGDIWLNPQSTNLDEVVITAPKIKTPDNTWMILALAGIVVIYSLNKK